MQKRVFKKKGRGTFVCKLLQSKQITVQVTKNSSSKCRRADLSRNMSHRNYGSALCFLQIKSSTHNDSHARAHCVYGTQYIFFYSPGLEPARAFPLTTTRRRSRSFIFVYRLDCYSRDKMPARGRSMKWSCTRALASSNDRIKLNISDAESKNHKA